MLRRTWLTAAAATLATPAIRRAQGATNLDFYYPIAVGGPLPAILDEYCRQSATRRGSP